MAGETYSREDVDVDLIGLIRAVWDRKVRVLAITLGLAATGFAIASIIPPKYQAESRILIDSRMPQFTQGADGRQASSTDPVFDDAGVNSQVQVLQSIDLIKAVSRKLKLDEVAELDPTAQPSMVTDVMVLLGLAPNPLDTPPEERVVQEFTKRLSVYQVEKSRVIAVQFSSKDPQLAAAIPNAMAEIYMSLQSGAKLDDNQDAARWLEPEIANLREKVRAAEAKVAEYRSSNGLVESGAQTTLQAQQLADISQELARVRGERAQAEAKAENVRAVLKRGGNVEVIGDVVGSQVIQRLKDNQSAIERQIADLSVTHLEGHPKLKAARAQLADVRNQIATETRAVLASLVSDADQARMKENQLVAALTRLKADAGKAGEEEVGLKALEREAASQRQLLETYLARYREASSRADSKSTPADARIVSGALVPTLPYFPKVIPITAVAGAAGFLFSAVAIMLSELLSGRALRPVGAASVSAQPRRAVIDTSRMEPVATPRNAANDEAIAADHERARLAAETALAGLKGPVRGETRTGDGSEAAAAAPMASLPVAAPEVAAPAESDPALEDEMSDAAESFLDDEFSVASVARYLVDRAVPLAVCVSPSDAGATASVMLARTLAEKGGRVVLVDMTGNGVPTRLMAESQALPGITNLLAGDAPFGDVIHADRLSDAHIIPRGTANPARAMKSFGRLAMIADALSRAYDIALIECGPANAEAVRALMSKRQSDIVISVGDADRSLIEAEVGRFIDAGYEDIVLLLGPADQGRSAEGRKRA